MRTEDVASGRGSKRAPWRKEERTRLAALASKAQPLIATRPVLPCTSAAPPSPCARALMRMRASVTRQGNDTCGAHGRRAVAPEHAVGDRRRAAAVCRPHSATKACGVELEGAADNPRGARAVHVDRAAELRSEHGSQQRGRHSAKVGWSSPCLRCWRGRRRAPPSGRHRRCTPRRRPGPGTVQRSWAGTPRPGPTC